ncbi:XRE family transcriptional regulator [Candidatus Atribacteria bacterium 1244-E10-H5-B2]|nr:MAG: XRE family transcriptional regulator [Candidatus Atribacteria bacterium 1244-E10-H5-B2]
MIKIKNLRKLREKAGLTQTQLGAKVRVCSSTIFRWEQKRSDPCSSLS